MEQRLPRRKHTRLDAALYANPALVCSVTIAVKDRRRVFEDPEVAGAAVRVLQHHRAQTGIRLIAFCVMPDHIHLLLSPSPTHDIISFVAEFKNLAQRAAWALGVEGAFWQQGFWDHFVRSDEDLHGAVGYVLANPVRAGLVWAAEEHPFSGFDFGESS